MLIVRFNDFQFLLIKPLPEGLVLLLSQHDRLVEFPSLDLLLSVLS